MRKIPGFKFLYFTHNGKVWSTRHKRFMVQTRMSTGYLAVSESTNGRHRVILAHRAKWEAYRGPIPRGMVINHKNGVKTDNRLCNLEVCTPAENNLHCIRVLKRNTHRRRKLTEPAIEKTREMLAKGFNLREIERALGINKNFLSRITRQNPVGYKEHTGTFPRPKVRTICMRKRGKSFIAWWNDGGKQVIIGSRTCLKEVEKMVRHFVRNNPEIVWKETGAFNSARSKWTRKK